MSELYRLFIYFRIEAINSPIGLIPLVFLTANARQLISIVKRNQRQQSFKPIMKTTAQQ